MGEKINILVLALSFVSQGAMAICSPAKSDEPVTDKSDWGIVETAKEAKTLWEQLYLGGKRLRNRAFVEASTNKILLPSSPGAPILVDPQFILNLSGHIHQALTKSYGEHLFYPDMGHAHLFRPEKKELDLQEAMKDHETKILYHTAELYRLRDKIGKKGKLVLDEWFQWRYYSRNFVGENAPKGELSVLLNRSGGYNTVRSLFGHRQVGTIYFSGSAQGCFDLNRDGKSIRYDISIRP
ncbi:hypothetical protein GW916_05070 [bacterium]|nr:hypothetical protein [bacterium]